MTRIVWFCWNLLILIGSCDGLHSMELNLAPNNSLVKEIGLNPTSVFLSGSAECLKMEIARYSGSIEVQIPDEMLEDWIKCGKEKGVVGKIYLHLENPEDHAIGQINFSRTARHIFRAQASETFGDPNEFAVSENNPYIQKVKLQSLLDNVLISVTSENVEHAVEVFISFCSTKPGVLYTISYAPNFEITLKSPQMELYYDSYSCDSDIAFYSNSTQPTSPLIIRLESKFYINGTMLVLINGAEPTLDSHVAEYETGKFTLNGGEMKVVELKYQPTMKNIQAYLDVLSGGMMVYLSPCKSQETDMFYSNLTTGTHRIDIDIEAMMDNTTCSLAEIDPSTVYMFLKPSVTTSFSLWIPGEIATWYVAITIGLIILLLVVCMILIIHFGRKKTGKLVINRYQK
ncbi:hypothetical protein GCK72_013531 [Caenorhabditis remanei]|uniref:Uncharacterized protein n=1 Tax=Caenorhabditis remanei TaxID=31234 RepID=A0A6A5GRB0_CAERE|nr:hypothetical protein GCK72_013531 [Caenorhabditis remanei]KAF1757076.1 hypothetical protein GCK72_013531 [Caenorhabditis remanei]